MVEGYPQFERTHLLIVVIQYQEVSFYSIVLSDQLEQRHLHIPQHYVIVLVHRLSIIFCDHGPLGSEGFLGVPDSLVELRHESIAVVLNWLLLNNVVSDFKDSSFVFDVLEYRCVHLHLLLKCLIKYGVEGVIEES
jgi:hypothetical protein